MTPWTAAHQAILSITISWSLLTLVSCESGILSNYLILCHFHLLPSVSQHHGRFQWVSSSHQEAKVLKLQLHHQSFQWRFRVDFHWDWLVWSPCCPRDSQESSPALQFRNINSSVLNFLYGLTLTSIYDYWKSHTFDCMDLCQLSDISLLLSSFVIALLPR